MIDGTAAYKKFETQRMGSFAEFAQSMMKKTLRNFSNFASFALKKNGMFAPDGKRNF